jgi:hypothetical protein
MQIEQMARACLYEARKKNGFFNQEMVKCMDHKCGKMIYREDAYKIRYGTKKHNFCYDCYRKHMRLKKNQEAYQ